MKAKRKSDGAIIEVTTKYSITYAGGVCFYDEDGKFYSLSDLDFSLSEPEEEVTVDGFVARDEDGILNFFHFRPTLGDYDSRWYGDGEREIPEESFPSVTFQNSPQSVTITIKPKKK